MKQWPASVNSRFAEVTENGILRMQDITIPNDTKKAAKLGLKVFTVFIRISCLNPTVPFGYSINY